MTLQKKKDANQEGVENITKKMFVLPDGILVHYAGRPKHEISSNSWLRLSTPGVYGQPKITQVSQFISNLFVQRSPELQPVLQRPRLDSEVIVHAETGAHGFRTPGSIES